MSINYLDTVTMYYPCLVGKPTGRFSIESDDTEYGKVSYARFHMLFGFRPASGQESVTLVCPHCRL